MSKSDKEIIEIAIKTAFLPRKEFLKEIGIKFYNTRALRLQRIALGGSVLDYRINKIVPEIMDYLKENPGASRKDVMERFNLSTDKLRRYQHFFPLAFSQKKRKSYLDRRTKEVLDYLQEHPKASQTEIRTSLHISGHLFAKMRPAIAEQAMSSYRKKYETPRDTPSMVLCCREKPVAQEKVYSRWTGDCTEEKHRIHHRVAGKLVMSGRFDAYVDVNAGPGIYTPENSDVSASTICSGLWVVQKFGGLFPMFLWENGDREFKDLVQNVLPISREHLEVFGKPLPVHLFKETNGAVLSRLSFRTNRDDRILVYGDPIGKAEEDMERMQTILQEYPNSTLLYHSYMSPWRRSKSDCAPWNKFFEVLRNSRKNCQLTGFRGASQYFFVLATDLAFEDSAFCGFDTAEGNEMIENITGC
jgi:hypothetical protein